MEKIAKALVGCALLSLLLAIVIKKTSLGQILPGPMPVNWAKMADTLLLFSIAISLAIRK